MLAPPHRRVLRVLPEPTREDYQQISIWPRFLPMKKLYLARIVFGTMLAVLEVKCRSSGTFMPLPVCLFTIVFCYVICNTMLVIHVDLAVAAVSLNGPSTFAFSIIGNFNQRWLLYML